LHKVTVLLQVKQNQFDLLFSGKSDTPPLRFNETSYPFTSMWRDEVLAIITIRGFGALIHIMDFSLGVFAF
jgi:hypothetical protein